MDQRFNGDPDLPDAFDTVKREILLGLNCHVIATVQEFDAAKQTIKATVAYKKTYIEDDGSETFVDYPILLDVPVISLGGGKAVLTLPITKGDDCLILFNDRDIDNWFEGGGVTQLASDRLHSFTDGFALVGIRSKADVISNYSTARAELRNDKAKVSVGPAKIKIANDTLSLVTILNKLLTALAAGTTVNTVPGSPAAFNPTLIAAINQAKTDIGGLLE